MISIKLFNVKKLENKIRFSCQVERNNTYSELWYEVSGVDFMNLANTQNYALIGMLLPAMLGERIFISRALSLQD